MKKRGMLQYCAFVFFCVAVNFLGQLFATSLQLPLWLDSVGTVLCTYAAGPVCGSIVGVTGNLIWTMKDEVSWVYSFTSIALALCVSARAQRHRLDGIPEAMNVSILVTTVATAVSVPLNFIANNGMTGNKWGDATAGFMAGLGFSDWLSKILGQLYLELGDKIITMIIVLIILAVIRRLTGPKKKDGGDGAKKAAAATAAAVLLTVSAMGSGGFAETGAEEDGEKNYSCYVQTVYSSTNGLPCGEANDISQTNDGIIWIGTYAGLYRYNGREFRRMNYDSVRNVNCLYTDEEGRLWIGTNDNGLSIAINENIVNVIDSTGGLPSNSVRSIIKSSDGYYYVGTTTSMIIMSLSGGLKRVNTLREVYYAEDSAADDRGNVATVTSDGKLFLLKNGHILCSRQMVNSQYVYKSCEFDKDGMLLAGTTGNEIITYDITDGAFEEKKATKCPGLRNLKDLSCLDNGELFVSADNGTGYFRLSGEFQVINTNDFNNSIDNMMMDYQGNLWFTSSRLGLLRLAPSDFVDIYSTVGMENKVVNTITKWNGIYYFGTDTGLDAVDGDRTSQVSNELTEQLAGIRIRCMITDQMNHLWICTYGSGLLEIEPDGTQHLYDRDNGGFGNRARLAAELSDGTIIAGGDTGISFIKDHEIIRTIGYADGLINSMILTVTEMEDGRILAGTDGNGIAVLEDGEVSRMLTRKDGLSSEVILRTVRDPVSGGVFIVTSNGLCYMEKDESIRQLDTFPYFNNYDIWMRGLNQLLVMSSAGIYVVDREELLSGEELSYTLLDSRRGLNSSLTANSWNYFDEQGQLFLPCDTGVFVVSTNGLSEATKTYRMSVASVRLDGEYQRISQNEDIVIERAVSRIELFPEVVNYTIQDPYVGYIMEGFENKWTIVPQNSLSTIVYTNLPSGSYNFRLAVYDDSMTNIVAERTYGITKEKELYDDPRFVLYILLMPMLTVGWVTWSLVRKREARIQKELDLANREAEMGRQTIVTIAKTVDAKDERTKSHSDRVARYSAMIAEAAGMSAKDVEDIHTAALIHDIGKIGIKDSILNKPDRLNDEEYAEMKTHTIRGAEILKDFTLMAHVDEGARYHHERYDGKGYPAGLKGEEIPLFARIIGVADAFDAMTANRVYRKQMDFDYVLKEMEKGRGTQFDPQFVDILLKLIKEKKIDPEKLYPAGGEEEKKEGRQ